MVNRERWRYSYYRKCYLGKLRRFEVMLPVIKGELDEDLMERMIEATPYWSYLSKRLAAEWIQPAENHHDKPKEEP